MAVLLERVTMSFGEGDRPRIITVTKLNTLAKDLLVTSKDLKEVWVLEHGR